jgi:hypothetical protein
MYNEAFGWITQMRDTINHLFGAFLDPQPEDAPENIPFPITSGPSLWPKPEQVIGQEEDSEPIRGRVYSEEEYNQMYSDIQPDPTPEEFFGEDGVDEGAEAE